MTRARIMPALAFTLALTACGGDPTHPSALTRLGRAIGFVETPPPPSLTVEVACDASEYATCTAETLDATLVAVLPTVAERPGSVVRVWMIGAALTDTAAIATEKNTIGRIGNVNALRSARARWVDEKRTAILTLARPYFTDAKHRSPIAEALTAIALASVHTDDRVIVVITDGKEVSPVTGYDFECDDPLPAPTAFTKSIERAHILPAGMLTGTPVVFSHFTVTDSHRKHCAEGLDRFAQIKDLWTAAVEAAGGTAHFETGAVELDALLTPKGAA